jgi:hypothetical protein
MHARPMDVGDGKREVVREVSGERDSGKSRVSRLYIKNTNSEWDILGVLVRKIIIKGGDVELGEELRI